MTRGTSVTNAGRSLNRWCRWVWTRWVSPHRYPMVVILSFFTSRLYAYHAGLRFDGDEWRKFWHFADPVLLQNSLLESVYYLHSQPPLANLVMGVALKSCGSALPQVFACVFFLLGLLLAVTMFSLACQLKTAPWLAALLTSLWCASPAMILFENFLFYTYPVLALLVGCAFFLHRSIRRQRHRDMWMLCAIVAAIVLTRSLFHPLWMLAVFALTIRLSKQRKRMAIMVTVPLFFVGCVVLKNKIEFDCLSLSSWRGMNIARTALHRLPKPVREGLIAEKIISPWARVGSFKPLARYPDLVDGDDTGIAILDQELKSNGSLNLHHRSYVHISKQLELDATTAIYTHPRLYLLGVGLNLLDTMRPAASYRALKESREHLRPLERLYELPLSWHLGDRDVGPWLVALPLLIAIGLWLSIRVPDRADRAVWMFALGSIVWVVLLGAMAERTENARFRFLVDPFLLLIAGRALTSVYNTFSPEKPKCQSRHHSQ